MEVESLSNQQIFDSLNKLLSDNKAETTAALAEQRRMAQEQHRVFLNEIRTIHADIGKIRLRMEGVAPKPSTAEVVPPASSITRSTASLRVLSSVIPTDVSSGKYPATKDDLCPGVRRLSDLIVSGSASPTTAAPPPVPSSGVRAGNLHEPPPATTTATRTLADALGLEFDENSASPDLSIETTTRCSMECSNGNAGLFPSTTTPATATMATNSTATVAIDSIHEHLVKGDMSSTTSVSQDSANHWDQVEVYPPLADLRRALLIDVEWAAMSEWEKDMWEMKHLPEKERMNSIEGIVMWLPVAQRDQRRTELLEEVLRFGEPAPALKSSPEPASYTPNISIVLRVPTELEFVHDAADNISAPTPSICSTICLVGEPSMMSTPMSLAELPATSTSSVTTPTMFMESAASDLLKGGELLTSPLPAYGPTMDPVAANQEPNMCKDTTQALLWNWFLLECTQLVLWAVRIPWPPDFLNMELTWVSPVPCSIWSSGGTEASMNGGNISLQLVLRCNRPSISYYNPPLIYSVTAVAFCSLILLVRSMLMGTTPGDDPPDLSAGDGARKINTTTGCMILAAHIEKNHESEYKTLIRCWPDSSDDALVNRVLFPLLEAVVKLVMFLGNLGGAIHLQFPRPLQGAQVYWSHFHLELVIGRSLQTFGRYCTSSDPNQWDRDLLHWKFPCSVGWFQFCPARKAFLYGYNAALHWEISWPTAAHASVTYGMHMYLILECSTVLCYMGNETNSLAICYIFVLHLHWDPGGSTQHQLRVKQNLRGNRMVIHGNILGWYRIWKKWDCSYPGVEFLDVSNEMALKRFFGSNKFGHYPAAINSLHENTSAATFHLHAYVTILNFCSMKFGQGKLSWALGIWTFLCFELQFSEMAFLVWFVFSWDPDGSASYRLEVKPDLKERGIVSDLPYSGPMGWHWADTLGLGASQKAQRQLLHIPGSGDAEKVAWNGRASAWCVRVPLLPTCVSAPLCLAMASPPSS